LLAKIFSEFERLVLLMDFAAGFRKSTTGDQKQWLPASLLRNYARITNLS
jgi:hypothetical protein